MHRRWLSRALIALAVPAAVTAVTLAPATAGGPGTPTIQAAAKIYPHLEGGTATVSSSKVYGPGKNCKPGKAIKGASARMASYAPDYTSGDPSVFEITGKTPSIYAQAMKFPSTKAAVKYLHGYDKQTKKCPTAGGGGGNGGGSGAPKCTSSMKKIKTKLGDERWGYQIRSTCTIGDQKTTSVFNSLFVRKGRFIVYTGAMSMDATAPSIPKSVTFTKVALKAAR